MSAYRSSPAFDRQYPDCPCCGRDLADLKRAIFCPCCGLRLQYKITARERLIESASAILHSITQGRLGHIDSPPATRIDIDRTPIMIGYGKAMFKLGWHYERSNFRNLSEAIRCYRKSARLGNADATVRLAEGQKPLRVMPIEL